MSDLTFAINTNELLKRLPYWFKMRKTSKDSTGARYLNIMGLELDDAMFMIDYAYNQCYIDSIDLKQIDFCYKTIIPMPYKLSDLKTVFANGAGLYPASSLEEFFGIGININNHPIHTYELFYADVDRNIIYVRQAFNADAVNNNGKIIVEFNDGTRITQSLVPHHVWNFLDELGALLSCPRIPKEPNVEYKKRIQDVFINKANASKHGLINGIARELALRTTLEWKNPYKDLELEDSMIVLNSIKINGEFCDKNRIFITSQDSVLITAYEEGTAPDKVTVTYVHGLEMHEFHNLREISDSQNDILKSDSDIRFMGRKDIDVPLYNELYTVEEKPKSKLYEYIKIVNTEAPIFWDYFNWNEHYWDQNESGVSGVGYIPNLYDGSVMGFENYDPNANYDEKQEPTTVDEWGNFIVKVNKYFDTSTGRYQTAY